MKYTIRQNGEHPTDGYAIIDQYGNCVMLTSIDDFDNFTRHKRLAEFVAEVLTKADFNYGYPLSSDYSK